jgi:hypothetical protein
VALALLAPAAGCDNTLISVSTDGQIEVRVSTVGSDPDTDGFSISVDGGTAQFLAPGATITVSDLRPGTHSVSLSGLADNCLVNGANPRSAVVAAAGSATVAFEVRCTQGTRGGFLVMVTTTGNQPDPDGYDLAVAGAETRGIGLTASETYLGLVPGVHIITLKDVDTPCAVAGGNPQPFTVVARKTVTVRLTVVCGPGGEVGPLQAVRSASRAAR